MSNTMKFRALKLALLLLTFLIRGTPAYAQFDPKQSPHPAIADKGNEGCDLDVEGIAKRGEVEAVPMLEKKFARTGDVIDKEHIASALVRLGDKKDVYWDFLEKQATVAIESGIPDFMGYDSQGKSVPGPSLEFTAWAQAHDLSPAAAEEQVRLFFAAVTFLAVTGDQRAVPLLRRALSAHNYMIQTAAAQGLAAAQDTGSIPLIIDAVKKAPAESGAVIAQSLA